MTLYLHATHRDEGMLHFKNVIVPIDLFDMVYLDKHETMYIETDKKYLPNDKRNTVYKAIMLMKARFNIADNFKVRIVKNIPAQSGLGGGSADAATVIMMLNDMYNLDLDDASLIDIASQIDEDTPFCLFNKAMLVEGIGDKLTPIPLETDLYYLLVKPGFGVSTKSFLKRFKEFKTNDKFKALMEGIEGNNYQALVANTHNDFQKPVTKRNGRLRKVVRTLKEGGLEGVCMSGSGTTVFGITQDLKTAMALYEKIVFDYPFVKYGRIGNIES